MTLIRSGNAFQDDGAGPVWPSGFKGYVLQPGTSTPETRAILHAALLRDMAIHRLPPGASLHQSLSPFVASLREGSLAPVGSVEFLRMCFAQCGISDPDPVTYPGVETGRLGEVFWGRRLYRSTAGAVATSPGPVFVKPVSTKLFTGLVWTGQGGEGGGEFEAFAATHPSSPVWVSDDVLRILGEWRVYVLRGEEIGRCRYDPDGPDDVAPCDARVSHMVSRLAAELQVEAFALDVAVTADGMTVPVEANDAWALGLYGGLESVPYATMLALRWQEIALQSSNRSGKNNDTRHP